MRKLLALAILAGTLSLVPGHADPGNGCFVETTGAGADVAAVCTYDATGPGQYVVATPNQWSIIARRGSRTLVLAAGAALDPRPPTPLASQAGDRVTVTVGPDCVPDVPVCGWIGTVSAFETE